MDSVTLMPSDPIQRLEDNVSQLYTLQRVTDEKVNAIQVALARIEERLAARKECPSPGACMKLQETSQELEKRLREVEDMQTRVRGGWSWVSVLGASVVSAVGAVITVLAFFKKP
jgi:hypothetical protein